MKVVFILSDANRWDYIEIMPFLKEQTKKSFYVKKIIPGIGFCEISEYLSGIPSNKNGNFFQITFNGNYRLPKNGWLKNFCTITNKIPRGRGKIVAAVDAYLKRYKHFVYPDILNVRYEIPVNMIDYFMPTESALEYDDENFFPETNLLHLLRKKGCTYDISDFVEHNKIKGTDAERIARLKDKIESKSLSDFTLLYIGKGELAHITGTEDREFRQKMTEYDGELMEINESLEKNYKDDFVFIVLGDHGMVDVKLYINPNPIINTVIKNNKLAMGKDLVYFVDSTCLRVWIKDARLHKKIDSEIREYLKANIDNTIKITSDGNKYGDLIYMLKPGIMFFPDFFNLTKKKGMHGYTNTINEQWGLCVCMGKVWPIYKESMHLSEVRNLVCNFFNIETE